ncbi:MAG TPA: hypothetical protein VGR26_11310 [Acidimicrobiales bacterium]|nr:hypothetical protein [Acidimicrobiales bacterium]
MQNTAELETSIDRWRAAAGDVLALAREVGPMGMEQIVVDSFHAGSPDDELPEEGDRADLAVDRLIAESDAVLNQIEPLVEEDADARARATALLVADLETVHALLAGGDEVAVDSFGPVADRFESSFALLADQVLNPGFDTGLDAVVVPDNVTAELEEIENAAGEEVWELGMNGAVAYSASAFGDGLHGLLRGQVLVLFDEVRKRFRKFRDALKRAATKVVAWVSKRIVSLLPKPLQEKLGEAFDKLKDRLEGGAPGMIGSALGAALGRDAAAQRWTDAADAGKDLTDALGKVGEATVANLERIGWVTKGRDAVDKFGADVVVKWVGAAQPHVKVAYFCAVAAVFLFVGWQLWDGIRDIGALAP